MEEGNKLFDNLKYSCVMPLHKMSFFTDRAIKSVLTAMGDRKDIEFLILDDCDKKVGFTDNRIKHIRLPKIDLVNKLIIGTQLAKGEYYCNVDYDDLSHPKKFELFDKILKYNDIAGANQCVFFDARTGKSYKMKTQFLTREHLYQNKTIKYPWIQHSNSAIPLKWLRAVSYGSEKNINMRHKQGHIITDSPIWARAKIEGLKVGFFNDIDPEAWKECYQVIHNENVNRYNDEVWKTGFDEVSVEKPEAMK
jgi:hypothetical protein